MRDEEIVVVLGMSRPAGLFDHYLGQLLAAGIPVHIEPLNGELANGNLGDLNLRIEFMWRILAAVRHYRKLVLTDAWDMLFYGTRKELVAKVPDHGMVLCAERVCWPEPDLAASFPDTGTPWRYVNGGAIAGDFDSLIEWTTWLDQYKEEYGTFVDQRLFNRRRAAGDSMTPIDSKTELFYTMTQENGELVKRDGRPYNLVTGEAPAFIHFCAKTSPDPFFEMMERA